jgi:hypothetical protein
MSGAVQSVSARAAGLAVMPARVMSGFDGALMDARDSGSCAASMRTGRLAADMNRLKRVRAVRGRPGGGDA